MFRIDSEGNDNGKFTGGDPLIPTPATLITPEWMNAIQEELAGTVEGLGGTLDKADNGQLLARLNASYGRLGTTNTWTLAQTFAGNVSVGGTLGVTGNTSLGGSLAVTASSTLTGPVALNGATTSNSTVRLNNGGASAELGPGSANHVFLRFCARTSNPTAQSGYIGYPSAGDNDLRLRNDISGGNVVLSPGAGGVVSTTGNLVFSGVANPASNVALKNTLTPLTMNKVVARVMTNGLSGAQTVQPNSQNVASATVTGNRLVITFAQAFASGAYVVLPSILGPERVWASSQEAGSVTLEVSELSGSSTWVQVNLGSLIKTIDIVCLGAQ